MTLLGRHAVDGDTAALWQFEDSLEDESSNGLDLQLSAGTVRYTDLWPGYRGILLDGSTTLIRPIHDNALAFTGDFTLEVIALYHGPFPNVRSDIIARYGSAASDGTANTNELYAMALTGIDQGPRWNQQSGLNVNSAANGFTECFPVYSPVHYAVTRISNVIRWYRNGVLAVTSAALTTPTGGSSSFFKIGGTGAEPRVVMSSMRVSNIGKTLAQVKSGYNESFGPLFGTLA